MNLSLSTLNTTTENFTILDPYRGTFKDGFVLAYYAVAFTFLQGGGNYLLLTLVYAINLNQADLLTGRLISLAVFFVVGLNGLQFIVGKIKSSVA